MKTNNLKKKPKSSNSPRPPSVAHLSYRSWFPAVIVAVITVVVFLPALWNDFVDWDDYDNLVNNPHFRGLGASELGWMFSTFLMGHYQPLSWVTLGLDYILWGTNPFGYHLTNLVLHAANAVLFYFLSRKLLSLAVGLSQVERGRWRLDLSATFAALLFAIHPLRVESVAWVTERRDVLSGFFYLMTIHFYLTAGTIAKSDLARKWVLAALFSYALSLLSKATAITLPAVLLLLDVYPLQRLRGRMSSWFDRPFFPIWREKFLFAILAVTFALIAIFAQEHSGALKSVREYNLAHRMGQALYGINFYIWKTLLPVRLSPLYELPFDPQLWTWVFVLCGVGAVIITVCVSLLRQRWPALPACWLYYLILLVPVLGFAQSGPQLAADRYTYLATMSFALLAGAMLYRFPRSAQSLQSGTKNIVTLIVVPVVVAISLGSLTWQQVRVWRDTKTLWNHAIAVTPESSIAHYNLGRKLESEGQMDQAFELYRRAVSLHPGHADAHHNLARLLAQRGQRDEAVRHYRQALTIKPNDADSHNNLGLLLAIQGETKQALEAMRQAVRLDPQHARAYFNLGRILALEGNLEEALRNFRVAEQLKPEEVEIQLGLGGVLFRQGRLNDAAAHFERAVRVRPDFADAHIALARSMAAQGKNDDAKKHYNEAMRLLKMQKNHSPRHE